jgi:hypothetical protein
MDVATRQEGEFVLILAQELPDQTSERALRARQRVLRSGMDAAGEMHHAGRLNSRQALDQQGAEQQD